MPPLTESEFLALADAELGRIERTVERAADEVDADIEIGHLSASLCHLGNIATRVGRVLQFEPESERILNDSEASGLLRRHYRAGHWAVPKNV